MTCLPADFDFNKVDPVEIWEREEPGHLYVEIEEQRVVNDDSMRITLRHQDPAWDTENYQIIFWNDTGVLKAKGDWFEEPSEFKPVSIVSQKSNSILGEFYENGDPEPWIAKFDYPANTSGNLRMSVSTRESPLMAKSFKDSFRELVSALVSKSPQVLDEDEEARIYIKFLNGRTAQIEHWDDVSDEDVSNIFCVHETDHVSVKKYWTSVSAAITFSVAFKFSFPDEDGQDVDLILRRCPDDEHPADGFCVDILSSMQTELEEMLNDEIKVTIEKGFERLEKLIVGDEQTTNKPNRPLDRLAKKARKTR